MIELYTVVKYNEKGDIVGFARSGRHSTPAVYDNISAAKSMCTSMNNNTWVDKIYKVVRLEVTRDI